MTHRHTKLSLSVSATAAMDSSVNLCISDKSKNEAEEHLLTISITPLSIIRLHPFSIKLFTDFEPTLWKPSVPIRFLSFESFRYSILMKNESLLNDSTPLSKKNESDFKSCSYLPVILIHFVSENERGWHWDSPSSSNDLSLIWSEWLKLICWREEEKRWYEIVGSNWKENNPKNKLIANCYIYFISNTMPA